MAKVETKKPESVTKALGMARKLEEDMAASASGGILADPDQQLVDLITGEPIEADQLDGAWAEVSSDQVRFEEPGDTVVGFLKEKGIAKQFEVGLYKIEVTKDKVVTILGSTDLDTKLEHIEIGEKVQITLVEMIPTKNDRMFKRYLVRHSKLK